MRATRPVHSGDPSFFPPAVQHMTRDGAALWPCLARRPPRCIAACTTEDTPLAIPLPFHAACVHFPHFGVYVSDRPPTAGGSCQPPRAALSNPFCAASGPLPRPDRAVHCCCSRHPALPRPPPRGQRCCLMPTPRPRSVWPCWTTDASERRTVAMGRSTVHSGPGNTLRQRQLEGAPFCSGRSAPPAPRPTTTTLFRYSPCRPHDDGAGTNNSQDSQSPSHYIQDIDWLCHKGLSLLEAESCEQDIEGEDGPEAEGHVTSETVDMQGNGETCIPIGPKERQISSSENVEEACAGKRLSAPLAECPHNAPPDQVFTGGVTGPGPCMRPPPAPPPPPRVLRDSGLGTWRQWRPLF